MDSGCSFLLVIKTKSRNHLNTLADMWNAVSKKVPCFDKIMNEKQEQRMYWILCCVTVWTDFIAYNFFSEQTGI